jgi:hypothetical protein
MMQMGGAQNIYFAYYVFQYLSKYQNQLSTGRLLHIIYLNLMSKKKLSKVIILGDSA